MEALYGTEPPARWVTRQEDGRHGTHMTPTSATRDSIDLPPPPWLASLSPRLHLPPDLDARHFDVCVLYLLAAHDVFVEMAQMIHISQRKHGRAQGPEQIRGLGVLEG